jgi:aldose 1-epimerase
LTNELVTIIPEYGARIKELKLSNGANTVSILKTVSRIDSTDRDDIFTNAKLSPFAGRIEDGKYNFRQNSYSLPINYTEEKNASHGLLYDKNFNLVETIIDENYASCTLEYFYNNECEGYPFSYLIRITYKLSVNDGLIISTKIINRSDSPIPISDGWHLYFDLGVKVDELKLKLDVSDNIQFNDRNVPSGIKTPFNDFRLPEIIGNRQCDSCFKVNTKDRVVTNLISDNLNLNLQIWQDAGQNKYNYLVVYIPADRRSIAIEPLTSNINSFNSGEGLIVLHPGKEFTANFGITPCSLDNPLRIM